MNDTQYLKFREGLEDFGRDPAEPTVGVSTMIRYFARVRAGRHLPGRRWRLALGGGVRELLRHGFEAHRIQQLVEPNGGLEKEAEVVGGGMEAWPARGHAVAEAEAEALREKCGKDFGRVRVGMRFGLGRECADPFSLLAEEESDEAAGRLVRVRSGRVVRWVAR